MSSHTQLVALLHQQGLAPLSLTLQPDATLSVGGVTLNELSSTYATPLYVMDGDTLRHMARSYVNEVATHFNQQGLVLFACKANLWLPCLPKRAWGLMPYREAS
jgi:hypothetical protein